MQSDGSLHATRFSVARTVPRRDSPRRIRRNGHSSIQTNLLKVRRMCRLIRKHQPQASIVIGGHIANIPELQRWCEFDHVVRGDGVRWMRNYLGDDEDRPLSHPQVRANIGSRIMGISLRNHPGDAAATLIPRPVARLAAISARLRRCSVAKESSVEFYQTGDELFEIMCQLEENLDVQGIFRDGRKFPSQPKTCFAGCWIRCSSTINHGPSICFSSANVLQQYTMEQLVALGVSWVWMGLEGENSQYKKLAGIDTIEFVRELRHMVFASWVRASSDWRTTRPKTSTRPSNMQSNTARNSTNSCSTHRFQARPCLPSTWSRERCLTG